MVIRHCALVALAVFLLAGPSRAQNFEAEALVSEGIARRNEGRWEEALSRFNEAWRRYHSARALAQLGACELHLSRFAEADRDLATALQLRGDPYIETNRVVLQHDLDQARLRLSAAQAPVPPSVQPAPEPAPIPAPTPTPPPVPVVASGRASSLRTVGVVMLVTGGVAAATGLGAFLLGSDTADTYNRYVRTIGGPCLGNDVPYEGNATCASYRDKARTAQAVSVTGYIAGGVFGALGVIFLIAAPSSTAPTRSAFRVGPGPGTLGLMLESSF